MLSYYLYLIVSCKCLNHLIDRHFYHVFRFSYNCFKKAHDTLITVCYGFWLIYFKIKYISLALCCAYFAAPTLLNLGRKDVVFLIDGSNNTGAAGIAHIRDFILNIVQQLDVQPDQVRVAVVQYADKVKTEFSLKTHNSKPDVISAIKRLRQIGGRSSELANAINYIIETELKPSAGARPTEASQHLVVLTGGRSSQEVNIYGPLLKSKRVNCVGIGAGGADKRQLTQIATTTDDVLQVPTFPGLSNIRESFIARLSQTMPEEPPTSVENGKF